MPKNIIATFSHAVPAGEIVEGCINLIDPNYSLVPDGMVVFKGDIATAAAFPTLALVRPGHMYRVTADVTDNNAAKTNTGLSFKSGDEIIWAGSTWMSTDLPMPSTMVVAAAELDTGKLVEGVGGRGVAKTAVTTQSVVDHLASTANPHATTAIQVGADAAGSAAAAQAASDPVGSAAAAQAAAIAACDAAGAAAAAQAAAIAACDAAGAAASAEAAAKAYSAGTSGNWATAAPTTVKDAIDRMAALLVTLNSGNPIP